VLGNVDRYWERQETGQSVAQYSKMLRDDEERFVRGEHMPGYAKLWLAQEELTMAISDEDEQWIEKVKSRIARLRKTGITIQS
jgi:hypothetical protein